MQESNLTELTCSKELVSSVPEPVWEIDYSEPVPDLYPELSDSLKMEESDIEHNSGTKGGFLLFFGCLHLNHILFSVNRCLA